MNIKCPNCRHDFEVSLVAKPTKSASEKAAEMAALYRSSVQTLKTYRAKEIPRAPIDPDRPVSK